MDWDQFKDIVRFWIGWHVLDWLKPAAGGAVLTVGGWLIARYRQSPLQRELRGAAIGFIALTIAIALFAPKPPPKQTVVASQHSPARIGAPQVPGPAVTITVHEPCPSPTPSPHEITLNDGLNFISNFRTLEGTVRLKITAPEENLPLRNTLVKLFTFPNSLLPLAAFDRSVAHDPKYLGYMSFTDGAPIVAGIMGLGRITRFAGFQIVDDDQDSGRLAAKQEWQAKWNPPPFDADATPIPSVRPTPSAKFPDNKIIVHGSTPAAQGMINLLRGLGLLVVPGSKISADASGAGTDLVYIQLGHGSLWER